MAEVAHKGEIARVRETIGDTPLRDFAVPHIVVDDIFSEALVEQINEKWPRYDEGFLLEAKGNHLRYMYRQDYARLAEPRRQFWRTFNEILWPAVAAAAAKALAVPAYEVFGDLYNEHLSIDMGLTLMQADPNYRGHDLHTHFYHCPHWAFTVLLYIDPEDIYSRGTVLHRLLPRSKPPVGRTSYIAEDLDWRADVALDTFHWLDPLVADRRYDEAVVEYKSNRLFAFMDGPLAFHSVPFDNPDHTPNPMRATEDGRRARRRILRSHVKVHHAPFYAEHSRHLPEPLEPVRYMRVLAPNAVLSADDQRYREQVIRPFFRQHLKNYVRAARQADEENSLPRWLWRAWKRNFGELRSAHGDFTLQFADRIP